MAPQKGQTGNFWPIDCFFGLPVIGATFKDFDTNGFLSIPLTGKLLSRLSAGGAFLFTLSPLLSLPVHQQS